MLEVWCDGSSTGKQGTGACAAIVFHDNSIHIRTRYYNETVGNNVMELAAVLLAVEMLSMNIEAHVVTDSRNVIGWLESGWERENAKIKQVADAIDALCEAKGIKLSFQHVKGHSGVPRNVQCDMLARYTRETGEEVDHKIKRAS